MDEKITALYTNLYDASAAMTNLKSNGITLTSLNTSDNGLHIGFNQRSVPRKFPGAIASTVVKLEINVDSTNRCNAISVVEGSYGVID